MNVQVEPDRFLSVACEPGERIVFDRKRTRYHLLHGAAARLWDEIGEGGTFELAAPEEGAQDPVGLLLDAGLLEAADVGQGVTRRVWLRRTGKASAAAFLLPPVATITAPQLALGQGPSLQDQTSDLSANTNTSLASPRILESSPQTWTREERRQQRLEDWQSKHGTDHPSLSRTRQDGD